MGKGNSAVLGDGWVSCYFKWGGQDRITMMTTLKESLEGGEGGEEAAKRDFGGG